MSRQMWWGLDQAGNPVNQSMNDKEWFDEILPIYTLKPENPRQRDSKIDHPIQRNCLNIPRLESLMSCGIGRVHLGPSLIDHMVTT
jgi:hypothetical protein